MHSISSLQKSHRRYTQVVYTRARTTGRPPTHSRPTHNAERKMLRNIHHQLMAQRFHISQHNGIDEWAVTCGHSKQISWRRRNDSLGCNDEFANDNVLVIKLLKTFLNTFSEHWTRQQLSSSKWGNFRGVMGREHRQMASPYFFADRGRSPRIFARKNPHNEYIVSIVYLLKRYR